MVNPRERLFPYHLNSDEIEKEYRIWKSIEENLRQEREKKAKEKRLIEEQRMLFWDIIKRLKFNKRKHSKYAKASPTWENKRDKQLKKSLDNIIKRNGIINKHILKWEQTRDKGNKNVLKKSKLIVESDLYWERNREIKRNIIKEKSLKHKSIGLKQQDEWEKQRDKLHDKQIKWEENREKKQETALNNRINEKKRDKQFENAFLRRRTEIHEKKKHSDIWEKNREKSNEKALLRIKSKLQEELQNKLKWEKKREKLTFDI